MILGNRTARLSRSYEATNASLRSMLRFYDLETI
jgi:hypothetical protein